MRKWLLLRAPLVFLVFLVRACPTTRRDKEAKHNQRKAVAGNQRLTFRLLTDSGAPICCKKAVLQL
ncbi:hypothetical protein B9T62_10090 [Paenibacillus donghaensis]|uniref:Uncharacterized protein n=1 Tax=Paenibacillus donghaensis TaxID=414771 RepID=A0A2Z2K513_9BACL|nr:hypothetical protein B9T62_10090 [Paenibacillus donghaensis]